MIKCYKDRNEKENFKSFLEFQKRGTVMGDFLLFAGDLRIIEVYSSVVFE